MDPYKHFTLSPDLARAFQHVIGNENGLFVPSEVLHQRG